MDTSVLKGRIAEAFVENILRRAGYRVSRLGRETQAQRLLRINDEEFLPDFLAWKAMPSPGLERRLHRLLMIEVKYRASLAEYLRRDGHSVFGPVADQWPELYFVFVTDHPVEGRSCFQVVDLATYSPGSAITTVDLHDVNDLDIFPSTVAEYESLVRSLFSLLNGSPALELPRKPHAKISEAEDEPGTATSAG